MRRALHRTIDKVTGDIERWSYNTAVAALMEFLNTLSRWAHDDDGTHAATFDEALDGLLLLLAPMAPHLTAELWERRHPGAATVHEQRWPVADATLLVEDTVTMVIQVNGKVRARVEVPRDVSEEAAREVALAQPEVRERLGGGEPRRVVAVPPRLVNVIVG